MDHFAFIVSLFTLDNIFRGYSSFREIDITYCGTCQQERAVRQNCPVTPFSLSTLRTTTTSLRPTRISFWILRIRRLDNSDNRIMPSMLSYSRSLTYAPISAIYRRDISIASFDYPSLVTISYLLDVHHHETIDLRILLFIESTVC